MKFKQVFLICLLCKTLTHAQNVVTSGVIEFEKTINKFAAIEKDVVYFESMKDEFLRYKTTNKQFLVLKSNLSFIKDKTIFNPLPDSNDPEENRWNGRILAEQINIIYNDFSKNETVVQKQLIGEIYLIKDTIRSVKWKITDQTREIAGYTCRRANGLFMDSIYVVAFYTNEIPIQGGPESFSGLPGMILGVALPYQNVSWFATKVNSLEIPSIKPPAKGKLATFKTLFSLLESVYKPLRNGRVEITEAML